MKPRVLLAQRASVEGYPPVLHQAAILSADYDVTIIDSFTGTPRPSQTSPGIERIRVPGSESTGLPGSLNRLRSAMRFRERFRAELKKRPDVVIGYEPEAAAHLLSATAGAGGTLRIVHLHEHPDAETAISPVARWSHKRALERLHLADAVVVADQHRASELVKISSLRESPLVVMNCPPKLKELPSPKLHELAAARGMNGPVVLYHGAIGPDHGLEAAVSSIARWKNNASFLVMGIGRPDYLEQLKRRAANSGAGDRFFLEGPVPYGEVLSYVAGATLGLSLLETRSPNWRWAAGASNKRFEFAALGIPQVTNHGPGISDLFEKTGIAVLVDPLDAESIADGVNRYLDSPELRANVSRTARALHLSHHNYETQFQPVVDLIRSHISGRTAQAG